MQRRPKKKEKKKDHDCVRRWKSRFWFGKGTKVWWILIIVEFSLVACIVINNVV